MHRPRRAPDAFVVDRRVAEPDVVGDRAREQVHVLQHEAEQPAQLAQVELPDVHAVDRDAPALHVVEPQQQIDERRLSRSGGADDPEALARAAPRTTRPSAPSLSPSVGEPDVFEDDVAGAPAPCRADRTRRVGRPTIGSSSSLKIRSDDAIADCRTLNFSDMSLIGRKKRCEYCTNATSAPSVSAPSITPDAAVPDDHRQRQRADRLDRRIEHRVVEDRVDVRVPMLAIDLVEPLEIEPLAPEQLHGGHARDVLLQEGVDPRDQAAHDAVRLADVASGTTA